MSALGDLRAQVAGALAPLSEDWQVHAGPVDAIEPPAFIVVWADPMLTPATACNYAARLQIICAAARMDPLPGYEQIEAMLEAALPALAAAGLPIVQAGGSFPYEHGGLQYQAVRITLAHPVTLNGGTP